MRIARLTAATAAALFASVSGLATAQPQEPWEFMFGGVEDNGPLVAAEGIQILSVEESKALREVETKVVAKQNIRLQDWNLSSPAVSPFTPPRANLEGSQISLRPNGGSPNSTFGWIEAPAVNLPAGAGGDGSFLVFEVRYSSPAAFTGAAPGLRLRINTNDFTQYAEVGVPRGYMNANSGGTVRAYFDRNRLGSATTARFYIDLLAAAGAGESTNGDFTVGILETNFYTLEATGGTTPAAGRISAAYLDIEGDLFVHLDGNTGRQRVDETVQRYAYDKDTVVTIDNGDLYAYRASNLGQALAIRTEGDVIAAAVAGPHVMYLENDFQTKYYNIDTGEISPLIDSGVDGVASAGDGKTLILLDYSGSRNSFRAYQFDPTRSPRVIQQLSENNEVIMVNGRISSPQYRTMEPLN